MNWKEQLTEIEKDFGFHKKRDWKSAISLIRKLLIEYPNEVELYVRAIYILHNILLEEEYPDEDANEMIHLLQELFNKSKERFSDNAEYLFFIGKILYIAEWYFGIDDDLKSMEEKQAFKMQAEAMKKESNNLLYKWAYNFSVGDKSTTKLAEQILHDEAKLKWLKSKGFPGEYVLSALKQSQAT